MTIDAQLTRLGLFDARVPRYTSYPTAPHFGTSISAGDFTSWIQAIPEGAQISLYLHVPFCRRLCWFCACRTQGTSSDDPVVAYAQTLRAEVALLGRHLPGVSPCRGCTGAAARRRCCLRQRCAGWQRRSSPSRRSRRVGVQRRDRPERDRRRPAGCPCRGGDEPRLDRGAGLRPRDPEGDRAGPDLRDHPRSRAQAARPGHASLNADILYGLPHQTGIRIADSVQKLLTLSPDQGGALRLCPCALDEPAPADDPFGCDAHAGRAAEAL